MPKVATLSEITEVEEAMDTLVAEGSAADRCCGIEEERECMASIKRAKAIIRRAVMRNA